MTCVVCVLLLRALCRGGGSGKSEDGVIEMRSSESGAQFPLRSGEGRTSVVRGGRGMFLTRDVEGRTRDRADGKPALSYGV